MFKQKEIYEIDNRKNCYYRVIYDNGELYFYNRKQAPKVKGVKDNFLTVKSVIDGNKIITLNKILENSEITHNFSTFKYKDTLYATGGKDSWNSNGSFNKNETFEEALPKIKNFYWDYPDGDFNFFLDEKTYNKMVKKFPDQHNKHNQGIYLLEKKDSLWQVIGNSPIITRNTSNIHKPIDWRLCNFDGQQSMLYFPKMEKFYIYLRANIDWGVRKIQVGVCSNLFNWSNSYFRFPDFDMTFINSRDEFYMTNFFVYKDWVVGVIPYGNKKERMEEIQFYKSKDGVRFQKFYSFLERHRVRDKFTKEDKNYHMPVQGYYLKNNKFNIFIHNNYFGHSKKEPVTLSRYAIPIEKFEGLLYD